MSENNPAAESSSLSKPKKVNLRRPDIMNDVHSQVDSHYRSQIVKKIQQNGSILQAPGLTIRLAKAFGFCYGVERAIDLAYAARKYYANQNIYILGEIIHNPDVNEHLHGMGIRFLSGKNKDADIQELTSEDVVIIPAFGARAPIMEILRAKGCQLVDTTCGDVMKVWRRVRQYAQENFTSVIHGKSHHEETLATSSRVTETPTGNYLVIFTLEEVDYVCNYILHGGNKQEFLEKFTGSYSPNFDPDIHLTAIGVANQTTMLRNETEEFQHRLCSAMIQKYGAENLSTHFRHFDTICGATQERQNALKDLLKEPLDLLLVLGGYNSSNTSHLAEMGEAVLPTYFINNSSKIISDKVIYHYNFHLGAEVEKRDWLPSKENITLGITAGASCPSNLIENAIYRLFEIKNIPIENILS